MCVYLFTVVTIFLKKGVKIKSKIIKNSLIISFFLIAPWINFYSNTSDPVVDLNNENVGYYETHICDFNLFEMTKENLNNQLWNDLRFNLLNLRGKKTWDKCAKSLIDNI